MYKIMVVEDDKSLCSQICERLHKWGFEAIRIEDFKNIVKEYTNIKSSFLIMDVMLPYVDGFYYCNKIREV